ncbi:MAG: DUF1330 domain-containing protein [bacterium]|nr:DUF1330 domain-containing protein [bacterium]MCY3889211.1 DUF1330 domain-containing protein [bacterium]MCY3961097.1 DUF1330 domain-containing protein [bacterium]MCY4134603.1 DUF1330 domain-containing protein [bacterium]
MTAYIIVNYQVDNPEMYGEYMQGAAGALGVGDGVDLIAFDTESEVVEGDTAGHQTVVLKFDSKEKAREVWESDAYRAVVGKRHDATSRHFAVLVNGFGD